MNNKVKFLRGTSGEYAVAEKDNDTIYFTTDDGKLYIGDKEVSGSDLTIDDNLSDTSTNPVQNKVVKQAIDNKADKSLYGDTTINVGRKAGTSVGHFSTAEGQATTASSLCSHAEGDQTMASGNFSHSEGEQTKAIGAYSHAEGCRAEANGRASHAEGRNTTAFGDYSHTSGYYTKALHNYEAAYGTYNKSNDDTLFSVGDGTADDARHNAFEITTTGGKLHDKDIATTDLIPTSLPANGGNADTVDGFHADAFCQKAFSIERSSGFASIPTITDENSLLIYREFINKSTDASSTAKYWRLYCPNGSKYSDIRATATDAGVNWNITGTAASHILKVNDKKVLTEGESYGKQESGAISGLANSTAQSVSLSFTPSAVLIFNGGNLIVSGYSISLGTNKFTITPSSVTAMGTTSVRYIALGG